MLGDIYRRMKPEYASFALTALAVILIIITVIWIYRLTQLETVDCAAMELLYSDPAQISSFDARSPTFSYRLRDYYVKSAYNACSPGNFANSFVSTCALKTVIKQGARCLDFAIYAVGGAPIISTSAVDSFDVKETFNVVPFADAMETIADSAFASGTCPCAKDPLFIHLRIMSDDTSIYEQMASILESKLGGRLVGPQYGYENHGKNIGLEKLCQFRGKVIIIADKSVNNLFTSTSLDELVNIASGGVFMRSLRYTSGVRDSPDLMGLIEYNKKNMTIVLPDLSVSTDNYSFNQARASGCQFPTMCLQNFDANLEQFTEFFADAGTAFVLKPKHLRYVPNLIDAPPAQSEANSYKPRPMSVPGPGKVVTL